MDEGRRSCPALRSRFVWSSLATAVFSVVCHFWYVQLWVRFHHLHALHLAGHGPPPPRQLFPALAGAAIVSCASLAVSVILACCAISRGARWSGALILLAGSRPDSQGTFP